MKLDKWTAGLMGWAKSILTDEKRSAGEREYAFGVHQYAAFASGRGGNPYNDLYELPEFMVGVKDANHLINGAIKIRQVSDSDFGDALAKAHTERTALELREAAPVVQSLDKLWDDVSSGVVNVVDELPRLSDEAKQQIRDNFDDALKPIDGLDEESYCSQEQAWSISRLSEEEPDSFNHHYLKGVILATQVHEGTQAALLVDATDQFRKEWNGYSVDFMDGYITTMQRWGNARYFSRVAFTEEIALDNIELSRKISEKRNHDPGRGL